VPTSISRERLHAWVASPKPPILVEALGAAFFADAHLPGAVNIPAGDVDRLARRLLPHRDAPIVVYCSGSSAMAGATARHLEELGYQAVSVYEGGKEDWVEHRLPVERSAVADGSPS